MTHRSRIEYAMAAGIVALTTVVCFGLRSRLNPTDVAMVLLLAVVLVASRYHRGPALLASVLSIAFFDFAFVPPYYTFNVHDTSYFLTFGVMLAVALVMSRLMARIRDQAEEASDRERRTAALYALSTELGEAAGRDEVLRVAEGHIEQSALGRVTILLAEGPAVAGGGLRLPNGGVFTGLEVRIAAEWAFERGEAAGRGTGHCAEAEALVVPLKTPVRTLGVVAVLPSPGDRVPTTAERTTIEALAAQVAVALERTLLAERHEQARADVEAERLRTALLSSLSHDLRTPLGSIEGAASSLLEDRGALPVEVRRDLAEAILEESQRMSRLVANLLDMIRVETGALAVKKSWQPLEEVLGVVLVRLEERLRSHPVETRLPEDLPMVPVDELLLEQVFINLLENAARYTAPGTPIAIRAWAEDGAVVVEVSDHGPGVPAGEEEAVFRKFYRGPGSASQPPGGAGLGLTICRGIVAAHGGRIWVESQAGGGAAFRFTLPLEGPPIGAVPAERQAG